MNLKLTKDHCPEITEFEAILYLISVKGDQRKYVGWKSNNGSYDSYTTSTSNKALWGYINRALSGEEDAATMEILAKGSKEDMKDLESKRLSDAKKNPGLWFNENFGGGGMKDESKKLIRMMSIYDSLMRNKETKEKHSYGKLPQSLTYVSERNLPAFQVRDTLIDPKHFSNIVSKFSPEALNPIVVITNQTTDDEGNWIRINDDLVNERFEDGKKVLIPVKKMLVDGNHTRKLYTEGTLLENFKISQAQVIEFPFSEFGTMENVRMFAHYCNRNFQEKKSNTQEEVKRTLQLKLDENPEASTKSSVFSVSYLDVLSKVTGFAVKDIGSWATSMWNVKEKIRRTPAHFVPRNHNDKNFVNSVLTAFSALSISGSVVVNSANSSIPNTSRALIMDKIISEGTEEGHIIITYPDYNHVSSVMENAANAEATNAYIHWLRSNSKRFGVNITLYHVAPYEQDIKIVRLVGYND